MLGHSVGEFAAAAVAGIFSPRDAMRLVVLRARLMESVPAGGAMAAVNVSKATANVCIKHLQVEKNVVVAADNGPRNCVVSGAKIDIQKVVSTLLKGSTKDRVKATWLNVSAAFHSPLMQHIEKPFLSCAARLGIRYSAAQVPIFSTVTGHCLTEVDHSHWARQLSTPVLFADAVACLVNTSSPESTLAAVEVGPSSALCATMLELPCFKSGSSTGSLRTISVCRRRASRLSDDHARAVLLQAVGKLYTLGIDIDWKKMYKERDQTVPRSLPSTFTSNIPGAPVSTVAQPIVTLSQELSPDAAQPLEPTRVIASDAKCHILQPYVLRRSLHPSAYETCIDWATAIVVAELVPVLGMPSVGPLSETANQLSDLTGLGMDSLMLVELSRAVSATFQKAFSLAGVPRSADMLLQPAHFVGVASLQALVQQLVKVSAVQNCFSSLKKGTFGERSGARVLSEIQTTASTLPPLPDNQDSTAKIVSSAAALEEHAPFAVAGIQQVRPACVFSVPHHRLDPAGILDWLTITAKLGESEFSTVS